MPYADLLDHFIVAPFEVLEARVFLDEGHLDVAGRAVSLFSDDEMKICSKRLIDYQYVPEGGIEK